MSEITKDEVLSWLTHPCTITLRNEIQEKRNDVVFNWTKGVYTEADAAGTAQKNAQAIAWVQMLDEVEAFIQDLKEYNEDA